MVLTNMKLSIEIKIVDKESGELVLYTDSLGDSSDQRAMFENAYAEFGKLERHLPTFLKEHEKRNEDSK